MGPFASIELPTLLALIALVVTIGWLLWRSHRYLGQQAKDWSPPTRTARQPSPRGPSLNAPDDVVRWEVQMHETARELLGRLDSKMAALSQLVREADRAAARLEAAQASAQRLHDPPPAPDADTGAPVGSRDAPAPLALRPTDQAEGLKASGAEDLSSPAREVTSPGVRQPLPPDQRYEEIYTLADYGFDAPEIARRVGSPVGEVELILSLRRKQ